MYMYVYIWGKSAGIFAAAVRVCVRESVCVVYIHTYLYK